MTSGTDLLAALPVAVYTTDAEGRVTFYNDAAAEFWGHRPEIGSSQWCGSWRLYWPDGRPMAHGDCPMAVTLKEGRPVRGGEAVAERPDGTRVSFAAYPTLLRDDTGRVTGAINLLIDLAERKSAEIELERLAAIVSSSDDAIISKTLDGRVTSWNAGAERIFGYPPEEMIGQSITRIIPPELHQEEEEILAKLRRGERIEHFETARIAKDGRRVDISLTVSPLRDRAGIIVGASKVARDVTERKRSDELQRLLFNELNHRVKNTLAMIQAIASQSLRRATSPDEFVRSFNGRVQALARAHDLLVQGRMKGADIMEIVREQVMLGSPNGTRVSCSGPSVTLESRLAVQLALVLHELATNARKHGALSVAGGRLSINWTLQFGAARKLLLKWVETGVPDVTAPTSRGFGTTLIERSLQASGGETTVWYGAGGITCEISLPVPDVERSDGGHAADGGIRSGSGSSDKRAAMSVLAGKRILVVEDEALVAMEIESQLIAAGCEVIGPAATLDEAKRLVAESPIDAALVDGNLNGRPSDAIAAALTQKSIPFAFATGYGREALPLPFQDAPIVTKPFTADQLLDAVGLLLADRPRDIVSIRPKRP